jgi:hypothetical protein
VTFLLSFGSAFAVMGLVALCVVAAVKILRAAPRDSASIGDVLPGGDVPGSDIDPDA